MLQLLGPPHKDYFFRGKLQTEGYGNPVDTFLCAFLCDSFIVILPGWPFDI